MPFWQFLRNWPIGYALIVQPSISAHRKWPEMVASVWTKITIRIYAWSLAIQIQIQAVWACNFQFSRKEVLPQNRWCQLPYSFLSSPSFCGQVEFLRTEIRHIDMEAFFLFIYFGVTWFLVFEEFLMNFLNFFDQFFWGIFEEFLTIASFRIGVPMSLFGNPLVFIWKYRDFPSSFHGFLLNSYPAAEFVPL